MAKGDRYDEEEEEVGVGASRSLTTSFKGMTVREPSAFLATLRNAVSMAEEEGEEGEVTPPYPITSYAYPC